MKPNFNRKWLEPLQGPPSIKKLKETNEASGSFWTQGRARRTATSFGKTEGAERKVGDLDVLPHQLMALL
jgi:hypothetical protein